MTRLKVLPTVSVIGALLLTGCTPKGEPADSVGKESGKSAEKDASPSGEPSSEPSSAPTSTEPPMSFDPQKRDLVSNDNDPTSVLLLKDRVISQDYERGTVTALTIGVEEGGVLWTSTIENADDFQPMSERVSPGPRLSEDEKTVYTATAATIPGSGTQKDQRVVRVNAFDTEDGENLWQTDLPVKGGEFASPFVPHISLNTDDRMIVTVSGDQPFSSSLSRVDGKTDWTIPGTVYSTTDGKASVLFTQDSISPGTVSSLDLATGKPGKKLVGDILSMGPIGSSPTGQFTGTFKKYSSAEVEVLSLDPESGKVTRGKGDYPGFTTCDFQLSPTRALCSGPGVVTAMDTTTLRPAWAIDDSSGGGARSAPDDVTAFGDKVYGSVDGTGVILDAETGKDLVPDAGIAPFLVRAHGALYEETNGIAFAPAAEPAETPTTSPSGD